MFLDQPGIGGRSDPVLAQQSQSCDPVIFTDRALGRLYRCTFVLCHFCLVGLRLIKARVGMVNGG